MRAKAVEPVECRVGGELREVGRIVATELSFVGGKRAGDGFDFAERHQPPRSLSAAPRGDVT